MENQMPASDHFWACDTVWARTEGAEYDACAANVTGAALIERHPEGHPLYDAPCGVLILRVAGRGLSRYVWYN